MSNFSYVSKYLSKGTVVTLECDKACDFILLTDSNFRKYKNGERCEYYGGAITRKISNIPVPSSGNWNIVIVPHEKAIKYKLYYQES